MSELHLPMCCVSESHFNLDRPLTCDHASRLGSRQPRKDFATAIGLQAPASKSKEVMYLKKCLHV